MNKDALWQSVNALAPVSAAAFDELWQHAASTKLAKKQVWVAEGGIADQFCFVSKGFLKAYYTTLEGQEYVRNFAFEGEFMAPYTGLLTNGEAFVSIEAVEDSELVCFPYAQLLKLRQSEPVWEVVTRRIAEIYYVQRERRQYRLLTQDAAERYEGFLAEVGTNLGRISQQDIASYVGITPVSLSRIRANRKKG